MLVVMPPTSKGKGKAAAAASVNDDPPRKGGTSQGEWKRNSNRLVAEGFLPKVLEELGWRVHGVEPAGDCWAIATRAREMLQAGVNLKSLTTSQRKKFVAPARTDLAVFHEIVTPDDMRHERRGHAYHFYNDATFRKEMKKWGPAHSEPRHGKGRYFGGSRTEDECSGGPTLALWMAAKHAGVNLIELEKGTSAYASLTRAMLLCTHC